MNLCIDVGNTQVKLGIYDTAGNLLALLKYNKLELTFLQKILDDWDIKNAILSSVRAEQEQVLRYLEQQLELVVQLSSSTAVPIGNLYQTPQTLGNDRLAVSVGAKALYPNEGVLIVDAGTCITYDFVRGDGTYMGGSILPGITMRFRALHELTAKLPLVEPQPLDSFIGTSTHSSIQTGVLQGVLHELRGFKAQYEQQFGPIRTIVTGGDASYFESQLKNEIFALPNLVLVGLNNILNYNIQ